MHGIGTARAIWVKYQLEDSCGKLILRVGEYHMQAQALWSSSGGVTLQVRAFPFALAVLTFCIHGKFKRIWPSVESTCTLSPGPRLIRPSRDTPMPRTGSMPGGK